MIEKSLAGPIGIFVKFSTLQEYGVDKVFFLENENVDTSQRNIIFLARGEKATQPMAIAGTSAKWIKFFCLCKTWNPSGFIYLITCSIFHGIRYSTTQEYKCSGSKMVS